MRRAGSLVLALLLLLSGGALNSLAAAEGQQAPAPADMAVPAIQAGPDRDQKLAELDAALAGSGPRREIYDRFLPLLGARAIVGAIEKRNPLCHSEAHDLGRAVMALRGDVGTALAECGTGCNSACMHGVLLEAFGNSTLESLTSEMNAFCAAKTVTDTYKPGSCAHGIGHALMFVTNRDVDASLNACRYFDAPAMQYYCATGVFMENMSAPADPTHADLQGACGRHQSFPAACYRYQVPVMVTRLGSVDRVAAECQTLPAPRRLGCFHGLGIASVVRAKSDPAAFAKICSAGSSDDRTMCVEGGIEKLGDYDRVSAVKACDAFAGDLKAVCLGAAESGTYRTEKPSIRFYASPEAIGEKQPLHPGEDPASHENHSH